jgi:YebC/PmpR family DNA-binding regulatory protein
MPNDTVERNIKKASSPDQEDIFELTYELYGHNGVGILVEIITDNKNRTASDMRIATNKRGGSIANPGSVAFNFDRKGVMLVSKEQAEEEDLFLLATEAGAEDFEALEEDFLILTSPESLYAVREVLDQNEVVPSKCDLEFVPKVTVECDEESAEANQGLIDWLEDIDDVQAVYHNMA